MSISVSLQIDSHSEEVLTAMKSQIQLGLQAIGEQAEGFAKDYCPVDTGRLRDSITYITSTSQGSAGPEAQDGDSDAHGVPDETELQLGTNVEYARYQEYGDAYSHSTGKAHFLRDAIANHGDQFKNTMQAALDA